MDLAVQDNIIQGIVETVAENTAINAIKEIAVTQDVLCAIRWSGLLIRHGNMLSWKK